jgi:pimeloyl-ACP methyl ester carboxylesterase
VHFLYTLRVVQTTFDAGDGRILSYLRRGSGPLVVCVPGGPGMDPEAYFAAMDLPGHELLIFAPRGTGASSAPPTKDGYKIAGYTDDLESLRVHLAVDALTLYGNSHGGCVSLAYARSSPDRVARLVVTNAPARMDDAYKTAAAEVQRRFAETFSDGAERLAASEKADAALQTDIDEDEKHRQFRTLMARYVAREGPAEAAYLDRLCAAPMNWDSVEVMYAEMLDGLDLLRDAGTVTAPALVIAGEFDVVVPPAAMRLIADSLPNARYVEFPDIGHFPEVEATDSFSATLCEFLTE